MSWGQMLMSGKVVIGVVTQLERQCVLSELPYADDSDFMSFTHDTGIKSEIE